jgi:ribonuclease PH
MALTQSISLPSTVRPDLRSDDQLRPIEYTWDIAPNAHGSILMKCGNTQVICAVMIEETVPRWMKEQNVVGGWITAEYSMLPYSTLERKQRDISKGKIDGRSQEIQRLIGRSLRAAVNLEKLGQRTIAVDCDVLAADGGTRTTAITGAFLALKQALERVAQKAKLSSSPLLHSVAATSVGIHNGRPILDLCYIEDRDAEVDMNLVATEEGKLIEVQASGEESCFTPEQFNELMKLGQKGIRDLFEIQKQAWQKRPKI